MSDGVRADDDARIHLEDGRARMDAFGVRELPERMNRKLRMQRDPAPPAPVRPPE